MEEPSVLDYLKSLLTFWRKNTLKLPAGSQDEYVERQADDVASRERGDIGASAQLGANLA